MNYKYKNKLFFALLIFLSSGQGAMAEGPVFDVEDEDLKAARRQVDKDLKSQVDKDLKKMADLGKEIIVDIEKKRALKKDQAVLEGVFGDVKHVRDSSKLSRLKTLLNSKNPSEQKVGKVLFARAIKRAEEIQSFDRRDSNDDDPGPKLTEEQKKSIGYAAVAYLKTCRPDEKDSTHELAARWAGEVVKKYDPDRIDTIELMINHHSNKQWYKKELLLLNYVQDEIDCWFKNYSTKSAEKAEALLQQELKNDPKNENLLKAQKLLNDARNKKEADAAADKAKTKAAAAKKAEEAEETFLKTRGLGTKIFDKLKEIFPFAGETSLKKFQRGRQSMR